MITPLEFVEAPVFSRLVAEYVSDDAYRELQLHLARDPEAGDVIPVEQVASESCDGTTGEGAEGSVAACESSTTTSQVMRNSGS
jgi:hypothetical protein